MVTTTKTFANISEESTLRCKFLESLKKDHEIVVEYQLKRHGYELLKKEWVQEIPPTQQLSLKITYEMDKNHD